ncbi:MAG: hypothetical protein U0350_36360 [Caldilineaceae bacterium]
MPDISVSVDSAEVLARLSPDRLANDLAAAMHLAVGLTHRTLMGLKQEGTPPDQVGVLLVVKGILAGSFQMYPPEQVGNDLYGAVATNLIYALPVNRRRQYIETTINQVRAGVNDLFAAAAGRF